MRTMLRGKATLLFLTCAVLIAIPAIALADTVFITNEVAVEADTTTKNPGDTGTARVYVKTTNGTPEGDQNGCNVRPTNPLTVDLKSDNPDVTFPNGDSSVEISDCVQDNNSDLATDSRSLTYKVDSNSNGGTAVISVDSYSGGRTDGTRTYLTTDTLSVTINDTKKPTVTAVTPEGQSVPVNTTVTATFSEAMKATTINDTTFTLRNTDADTSVQAGVVYDADTKIATLTPQSSLAHSTNYEATVTTGAQDLAGNALDQDGTAGTQNSKTWSFRTAAPPCTTPAAPVFATKSSDATGTNGWFKTVPTVSASTTTAGSTITYATEVNDGTKSAYSATAPTLGQGTTKVYAKAANGTCPTSETIDTFKVDTVAPGITDNGPTTDPNGADWYKSAVTNQFTASDATSGFPASFTNPFTKSSTGEGSAVKINSGAVTDNAGNTNNGIDSAAFMIDLTKPSVSVTGVSQGATYTIGAVPTAGCSTTDSLSDVKTPATVSVTGGTLLGVGNFTATCSGAVDNADNNQAAPVSFTYKVTTNWSGFSSPVDNLPELNTAKAGQAIPLKWRITDSSGNPITNLTSVTVTVTSLSCTGLDPTPDAMEEYAAGSSGLQNHGNGYYQFNWKSPTSYANSCKTLHLDMGEGVTRTALFQFKR